MNGWEVVMRYNNFIDLFFSLGIQFSKIVIELTLNYPKSYLLLEAVWFMHLKKQKGQMSTF